MPRGAGDGKTGQPEANPKKIGPNDIVAILVAQLPDQPEAKKGEYDHQYGAEKIDSTYGYVGKDHA